MSEYNAYQKQYRAAWLASSSCKNKKPVFEWLGFTKGDEGAWFRHNKKGLEWPQKWKPGEHLPTKLKQRAGSKGQTANGDKKRKRLNDLPAIAGPIDSAAPSTLQAKGTSTAASPAPPNPVVPMPAVRAATADQQASRGDTEATPSRKQLRSDVPSQESSPPSKISRAERSERVEAFHQARLAEITASPKFHVGQKVLLAPIWDAPNSVAKHKVTYSARRSCMRGYSRRPTRGTIQRAQIGEQYDVLMGDDGRIETRVDAFRIHPTCDRSDCCECGFGALAGAPCQVAARRCFAERWCGKSAATESCHCFYCS